MPDEATRVVRLPRLFRVRAVGTMTSPLADFRDSLAAIDRYESALTHESQLIDGFFLSDPSPCWIKGLGGQMLAINPAYAEFYGLDVEQYVGFSDGHVWPDPTALGFGENDRQVAEEGTSRHFIESVYNAARGRQEELIVLKWPVYVAMECVGVGGRLVFDREHYR